MPSSSSLPPPPVGTFIDNGALELVEILGYGGYGCVYRAVDTRSRSHSPRSYAVKCLTHQQSARQRQLHMRETSLHRLASAHQNVATLHRVIEDATFTYIIMDYCPDGDLFSQILHQRRYLGNDRLIKHIFLQLLDAVEHCHSLGIYHRDIKPENVLCLDGGLRIALTDFGLATTDKVSQEFRTGSVYHMSPECQGGRFAPTGSYSPMFNDVWSLGIVLLNLATGRNPWKAATLSDPTFYAYLQSPTRFLPTVLPISDELNALLVRTLQVDWRKRITLRELRRELRAIDSLYADDVVFEESLARCAWEAGVDLDGSEESEAQPAELPAQKESVAVAATPVIVVEAPTVEKKVQTQIVPEPVASVWSNESDAAMVIASAVAPVAPGSASPWAHCASEDSAFEPALSEGADADGDRSMSSSPWIRQTSSSLTSSDDSPPSSPRSSSSLPSMPPTPHCLDINPGRVELTVDTACLRTAYFDGDSPMRSAHSSQMHTAIDAWTEVPWKESFFLAPAPKRPTSDYAMLAAEEPLEDEDSSEDSDDAHVFAEDDLSPSSSIGYATAHSSEDSLNSIANDADIEDSDMLATSPIYSPVAASTFTAMFFPPLAEAFVVPVNTAAGKSRKAERRGTGRFNPIRQALRSLSPSGRSRSKWEPTTTTTTATPFLASQDSTGSLDQATKTSPLVDERRGRTKRSWFAPRRRLFAS